MKKILFLLLCTVSIYGQTSTGQEQSFPYGIVNESLQTITTPTYIGTFGTDGTQGKIPSAYIAKTAAVQDSLNKKLNLPTGFLQGLQLSINADPTKFNIAAGTYVVTDFTNLTQPVVKIINYAGSIGLTPAYLATANSTYIALDKNQNVISSASPFTDAQRRTLAIIGNVVHSNRTNINIVNEIKAPIVAVGNQLHDFMKAIGFLNESGNVYSANGANLQINKSVGNIFGMGINASDYLSPHKLTIPSQTALTFAYRFQNGTQLADTQNINPNIYDVGGTSTATPSNKWTIQRINLFQSGLSRIQPGQTVYNSFIDATTALPTQPFVTEQNIADNAVFRCYLIVQEGTTNLASAVAGGTAQFVPVDKFGNIIGNGSVALTYSNIIAALGFTPANDADVVHKTGSETISGAKKIKNKLDFTSSTDVVTMSIPQLSTAYSAENTVMGANAGTAIAPIQFDSPTYGLITGGTANTLYGKQSGYLLNAGNENTLIGHKAGYNLSLTPGNDPNFYTSLNTLIGSNAGYGITSGYSNVCIGQKAGQNISINSHNVVIGKSAGGDGTMGTILDGNVIIGSGAAKESVYSRYNTFVGTDAGHFSDGQYNVFLGTGTGDGTNVSHHFIAGSEIGYINDVYFGKGYRHAVPTAYTIHGTGGVGSEITGGNLIIAGGTGTGNANGGDVVIQTSDIVTAGTQAHYLSDAVTIKSISQNVGIGTGSPSEKLEVNGNIKSTSFIKSGGTSSEFLKADGSVTTLTNPITGTGTSGYMPKWVSSSMQGNSIVSDNGTEVMVNGNVRTSGALFAQAASSGIYGYDSTGITQTGYLLFNQYTGVTLSSSTGNPLKINNNGSESARFIAGNLLIGSTTNTGQKLQVTGDIIATSYTGDAALTGTPTAPTAAPGTNTTQIATTAFVQATRPYKVYTALISQTGTSAPTATILENTLGGTVVWTRTGTGAYLATLSGVFTANKTSVLVTPTSGSTIASASSSSVNDVNLSTALSTTAAAIDGVLANATIEIKVYN